MNLRFLLLLFCLPFGADAALSYQWQFNASNVGTDSTNYTRTGVITNDTAGIVRVIVTGASGSVTSSPASLLVYPFATNFFVHPQGSSGNSGLTTNAPWDFQTGLDRAGPFTNITLMPGLYTNGYYVLNHRSGTAENPVVIKSQFKWGAVILNLTNFLNFYESTNVVVDGICISNAANDSVTTSGCFNTFRNCWIVHSGHLGMNIGNPGCSNNIVENCLIEYSTHGIFAAPNGWKGYGIYLSGPNNIIRNNVFRYNGSIGIHFYTGYDGVRQDNNIFYNNLTYGNVKDGIYCNGATGEGANAGQYPGTNYIIGNTVMDGIELVYGTACVSNNIVGPSGKYPTVNLFTEPSQMPTIRNDYNLSNISFDSVDFGVVQGSHDVVTSNLGFVNTNLGLYWLSATAPARNAAKTNHFGAITFFGNVAQPPITDIGFVQYKDTLATDTRTLNPSPAGGPNYWFNVGGGYGAPVVTLEPQNQTGSVGDNITFTVQATDEGSITPTPGVPRIRSGF